MGWYICSDLKPRLPIVIYIRTIIYYNITVLLYCTSYAGLLSYGRAILSELYYIIPWIVCSNISTTLSPWPVLILNAYYSMISFIIIDIQSCSTSMLSSVFFPHLITNHDVWNLKIKLLNKKTTRFNFDFDTSTFSEKLYAINY